MTDRYHFEALDSDQAAYLKEVEFKLRRALRTSQIMFDYIQSANYVSGSTGFKINVDGSAEFNSGVVIGADLYSGDWESGGGTLPIDLSGGADSGATTGYALDYSEGAAQFQSIYAEGGALSGLTVTGTLTFDGTGELQTNADGNSRLEIVQANEGRLSWVNSTDTELATVGMNASFGGVKIRQLQAATSDFNDVFRSQGSLTEIMAGKSAGGSWTVEIGGVSGGTTRDGNSGLTIDNTAVYTPKFFGVSGFGSAGTISFGLKGSGDDTGMYMPAIDEIGWSTQGIERLHVNTTRWDFSLPIYVDSGSVSAASVALGQDADTGLYSTATGVADVAAAGARVQAWNADGPMVENAITKFPSQVSATPAQITTFASTNWIAGTSYTLWTHSGTGRDVWVSAIARFEWGETAAVAYTGECRLGISFNGGSTWNYGATSIHYVGTGTGGGGYRGSGTVIYEGQAAAAAVTGDIQMRLEHKVSNTSMDRLVNQHIMGRVEQIF